MAENEVKTDAAQDNAQQDQPKDDSLKSKFSSFLSNVATMGKSVFDDAKATAIETSEKLIDKKNDWKRERDASEIYEKLGKKIYKLASRDEISLPECCEKYIAELDALYAEAESSDDCKCDDCKCEDAKADDVKADDAADDAKSDK